MNLSQLSEAAATAWGGLESSYSFQPTWWHREDRPAVHVFRLTQQSDIHTFDAVYVGNLERHSTNLTVWLAYRLDDDGVERQVETSA